MTVSPERERPMNVGGTRRTIDVQLPEVPDVNVPYIANIGATAISADMVQPDVSAQPTAEASARSVAPQKQPTPWEDTQYRMRKYGL